jgi:anaerobic magnesium-protoporphyrin IX monomethyl ester cyclase
MSKGQVHFTLIRAPTIVPVGLVSGYQGVPPVGMAYLASALRQKNYEVACIDSLGERLNSYSPCFDSLLYNGLRPDEVCDRVDVQTDFIGISCMFSNEWIGVVQLIELLRKRFPRKPIILGGEHVTAEYEYILANYFEVDFCVLGEGEAKLIRLVEALVRQESAIDLEGIASRHDGKIQVGRNIRVANIDLLPWPAWDLIPLENYLSRGLGFAMQGKRTMPVIASRGCPYRCTFCSNELMWGSKWKAREVDDLIREIKYYKNTYAIEHLEFYDLTAVVDKEWTQKFCHAFIDEKINLTWALPSGTRSEALTEDILSLLKSAGLVKIVYAPETGSNRLLKLIKKKVVLRDMLNSMRHANRVGLIAKANMVTGFPDETLFDVLLDFIFLIRMAAAGLNDVSFFCFAPYPGSHLNKRLISEGKIERDFSYPQFLSKNVHNSPSDMRSWSKHIPSRMIPFITLGGMAFFYFVQFLIRPHRIFQSSGRLLSRKPFTMLELAICTISTDVFVRRRYNLFRFRDVK